ncbi:unnamed protein product, partial [Polarella glacialis]
FNAELSDAELLVEPQLGKYLRTLDQEFRADAWSADQADDVDFFALLVQHGRACTTTAATTTATTTTAATTLARPGM